MKHSTKTMFAIFAVALMLCCAFVPLMTDKTSGEATSMNGGNPQITKEDLFGLLQSGDVSDNILTHNGVTLVKVDTSEFKEKLIPTTLDDEVTIGNNEIATLGIDKNVPGQPSWYTIEGGHITVKKGGMLQVLPLTDSYQLWLWIKNENESNIITMEYGSYLRFGDITFMFLTPTIDGGNSIDLLELPGISRGKITPTGQSYMIQVGSSNSNGINLTLRTIFYDNNGDHGDIPLFNWKMLNATFTEKTQYYQKTITVSANLGKHRNVNYLLGCEGIGITGLRIDKFNLDVDKCTITEENGEISVETKGTFCLKTTKHDQCSVFARFNGSIDDRYLSSATIRDDRFYGTGHNIDTGVMNFTINTTSKTDGDRTLNIRTTISSESDVFVHTEFPSFSAAVRMLDERLGDYDDYKIRASWGLNGENVWARSICTDFKFTNLVMHTDITIDGYDNLFTLNDVSVTAKNIELYTDYLGQINVGVDARWNNAQQTMSLDYYFVVQGKKLGMLIDITGFELKANKDQIKLTFNASCDSKTPYEGIDKSISFTLKNFVIDLNNKSDIIGFESFDLESDYPLDQIGYLGKETTYATNTREGGVSESYAYTTDKTDTMFSIRSLHIRNASFTGSALTADELTVDFFDAKYKGKISLSTSYGRDDGKEIISDFWSDKIDYGGKIIGDISITISKPSFSITDDHAIQLSCNEIAGSVKNLNANKEQFSVTDSPKIMLNNWLDIKLVSGKATLGDFWMPMTLTIDKGATLETKGTKVDTLRIDERAKVSGNIDVGDSVIRFNDNGDYYTLTNMNDVSYDVSMDLSDFGKAKVAANKGYYLPEKAVGDNYSFSADNRTSGTLTLNGGKMIIDIPYSADSYRLSYKDNIAEAKNYAIGDIITLTDKTPTKEGYTFLGWTDGSGKIFTDNYTMPARNVELRPVYLYDGEPQFSAKSDLRIEYIDAGDADVAYVPMTTGVDYYVVKMKDMTVTIDNHTFWSMGINDGVYLKAMKMDTLEKETTKSTNGMRLYDVGLYNKEGSKLTIPNNGTDIYVTVNVRSDDVKMNWIDDCGSMGSIAVYGVDKLADGSYDVTFKVSDLRTFGFEGGDSSDYTGITVTILIALIVILAIGVYAYVRHNKQH